MGFLRKNKKVSDRRENGEKSVELKQVDMIIQKNKREVLGVHLEGQRGQREKRLIRLYIEIVFVCIYG